MMADTIQEAPYEITLRFNCERGETVGQLRGLHRVTLKYLVGDDGIIKGRVDTGEVAQDFPADQLTKYLGDQFVTFNAQLEGAQQQLSSANTDLASVRSDFANTDAELTAAKSTIAQREETLAQRVADLDKATRDIADRDEEIKRLQAAAAQVAIEAVAAEVR